MPVVRSFVISLIALLFLVTCSPGKRRYIPEDKFAEILADMHVYDAMYENSRLKRSELKYMDSTYLYSYLFSKHNVTQHQFDTSLYYYTQHPEILLKITEKAYSLLEVRSEDQRKETEELRRVKWFWRNDDISTRNITGYKGSVNKIFHIPVDTTGKFLAKISLRFRVSDKSLRPYILGYFAQDTTIDSPKILLPKLPVFKSSYAREYKLVGELSDTSYKYIILHVVESENTDSNYYRNITISKVEVGLIPETKEKDEIISTNVELKK